ncbi:MULTISPECIES: glutamate-1-semialdehyde 2,1-aminomutase [Robiginitalea]|uniref:glutamate-1-semialdehyde 2,1-aminomutase n=1 Tax=Robiginitalea TaxID=252306 RepID=UPI0023496283|nr:MULTISPECIES: glutamate-1-semialdehyde 2,1-aminomutase [unclassified Robiginitalea]MDC6355649.1 glutamate-1-semialdehyde 2,1-aminomutase [Robiginitalea sp. PM2]MDC6376060.1 glutamate-1-semialdehyde 2,1-aminomutase [Robiginitalea sp. SP8]
MRYKRSSELFRQASRVLPGGVNSPVRAFKSVGGTPVFVREAAGSRFTDEDGNEYIDFIASWGPLLFGHAFPPVVEAVTRRAQKGTSFGMPTALETEVAELAVSMVPGIEKIRFVNSGTEACMSVIRLARGYTGREKIIKFAGCYHGHADAFLIEAGSGAVTFGSPNSPGVTQGTARDTLLARYNDLESVKGLFEANPGEVAAVILEPVAGNMGCIPPEPGFLEGIRQLCTDSGALLIFDEVMTGFRLAAGGAQEALGISADLVAFGKVIGGGLPVGAFGGPAEIMSHLAPEGPVYQAGTLSGNPLAMGAGLAMLRAIEADPEVFSRLESKTAYLHEGLEHVLQEAGHPYRINRFGSMISVHFTDREVRDFESAATGNNDRFRNYFHGMLNRGVYLPPSAFESYFLNDALTAEDLDLAIDAAAGALKD